MVRGEERQTPLPMPRVYRAGMRLDELVFLQWSEIRIAEFSIITRATRVHQERYVPLPLSILGYLENYQQLYKGSSRVFEGRWVDDTYCPGTVQQVMHNAVAKAGLDKKRRCTTALAPPPFTHTWCVLM